MSRFYEIVIGTPDGSGLSATFTNQIGGKKIAGQSTFRADPGALQVELDIQTSGLATPSGPSHITISGVSRPQIAQANQFSGLPITVKAGMQNGLPFATDDAAANQAGVICAGQVFMAYGNWIGNNQSLELVIKTDGPGTQDNPVNLGFYWAKGTPLSQAIDNVLRVAMPTLKRNININPALVLPADESSYYQTSQQFAQYVYGLSRSILTTTSNGQPYLGVDIWIGNGVVNVNDFSTPATPKAINFVDLIGQPTWLGTNQIQWSTVMRADLDVGAAVTFPYLSSFLSVTTPQSNSRYRDQTTFAGSWTISGNPSIRHVGNSRGPDAFSWVTSFQAYGTGLQAGASPVLATASTSA